MAPPRLLSSSLSLSPPWYFSLLLSSLPLTSSFHCASYTHSGDPLPPQGRAPSRVSQVDPLPGSVPQEVATASSAARGVASGGAEPASAEPEGAEPGGAESEGAESGGAEPGGSEPGGTEPEGVEPGGTESEVAESGGAEPRGIASAGGPVGASPRISPRPEPLSLQQLCKWFAQRTRLRSGAAGAGGSAAGGTRAGGAGARDPGAGDPGAGGARVGGTGAGGDGARGNEAGDSRDGGTSARGARARGARAGDPGAGGAEAGGTRAGGAGAGGTGARDPEAGGAGDGGARASGPRAGGTVQRCPYFVTPPSSSLPPPDSVLRQVLSLPSSTGLTPSLLSPPPHQSQPLFQPDSPLRAPSPHTEEIHYLTERWPVRAVRTGRRIPCPRPPLVPGTHVMALRPSSVPLRVPLPSPPTSSLPNIPDPEFDLARAASPTVPRLLATVVNDSSFESAAASALVAELVDFAATYRLDYATSLVVKSESVCPPSVGGECALSTDVLEDKQEDFECFAAAVPHLVSMLIAPEGDLDAPDIPTLCSYAEAITGPYSSQWKTAMDSEMASWKSTSNYVDAVSPPGANIVDGMWIFRVKRPPGSPPAFKARYIARGFSQRQGVDFFQTFSPTSKMTTLWVLLHVATQRDYELHSLDFSIAFLQGSLHEEIWLRRPPGFTGSFLGGTQWSLRQPIYGLRQAPREWHDTVRTTLVALGFTSSTADPSLFLCTDTSLPPFYVLVYVDDLVFATADTEALALVKSELQKRHTCTDLDTDQSTGRLGSSLYSLTTEPHNVAVSAQVSSSGQVATASCSCRLLSHQNLLWHHRLGHPSMPCLRGMHSRLLVSGLPRSLPPLPPLPAPPCLPCAEGWQRAAPYSSFPPTNASLQNLHMDIHAVRLQLRERFGQDLPVLRVHSDRGGEFSSDLLRDFCRGEGILQSFTLPASPQQNGIAERRIGLLNLWSRVSLPETLPTLRWTGKVGDASVFRVWGSRAFVRDMSANKLSARAIPCVFLGFPPDAPSWQFYHPTSRRVFPSQDVTFDESVPFYVSSPTTLPLPHPRRSSLLQVDPLPGTVHVEVAVAPGAARGAAFGGAASGGATSGGAEPGGADSEGSGSGGAEHEGAEPGGAEPAVVEPGGVEPEGVEPGGVESEGVESGGAEPQGTATFLGPAGAGASAAGDPGAGGAGVTAGAGGIGGARTRGTGAAGTGCVGGAGAGGAGVGDLAEPGGAGAGGTGAGGAGGGGAGEATLERLALDLEALVLVALELEEQELETLELLTLELEVLALGPGSHLPAPSPYAEQTHSFIECREPESCPASPLRAVRTGRRVPHPRPPPVPSDLVRASSPAVSRLLAAVVTNPAFESTVASALVAELVQFAAACRLDYASALIAESESASPLSVGGECALGTDVLEDRQEDFECLAAATAMDAEMVSWKSTGTYVDAVPPSRANVVDGMWIFRVKRPPGSPLAFKARYIARGFSQRQGVDYFQTFSPTPKMTTLRVLLHVTAQRDYELHSLDFSTTFLQGSLHEEIWLRHPPGFTGSFPAGTQWSLLGPVYGLRQAPHEWHDTLRTTLAALGFTPSTADPSLFLRTDTSVAPFYVLVYVDDLVFATADSEALTLVKSGLQKRHTCTDLGELCSYLALQIPQDRALRTITLTQSHMVHQLLQRFGFQFSSPQPTPLSTDHSLSAPPSDESVEPSGPYLELVGCLMYLMTCTRPDLAYPLSLLAHYVAPGRHGKVHWDAAKRALRYLCSTSSMGLVLGGWGPVVLTGHADASWVDDLATQRSSQGYTFSLGSGSVSWRCTRSSSVLSSSCEPEIYAEAMAAQDVEAMAAQELRWLTYLVTDLGEQPRLPPVLYVDNKAMIALCQEHRLEHQRKPIALQYFLARVLQQRGQLRLAYVATRANTADIFTKALQPGDHQRFSTVLGLVPTLPHLLTV
ncbi:unnamed protein product [Closterium sp. NIES-54]